MLNAQYLKDVLAVQPGAPPRVEGVILYEDFACGLRLKHAFDELFGEAFGRAGWAAHYRLSLWSFDVLRGRGISARAVEEVARSAVFCIAVGSDRHLGAEVVSLVQRWLAHQDGQPRAIVLAGYGDTALALRDSPAEAYLRMVTRRTGTTLLVHPLGPPPLPPPGATEGRAESNVPVPPPTAGVHTSFAKLLTAAGLFAAL